MIQIKSEREIEGMRLAGRIAGLTLIEAKRIIRPGVTTKQIDTALRNFIRKQGARPSFLGYRGFPASCTTSVNHEVIHGIPSNRRILAEGDIISIDIGAYYKGFHGDTAATFPVGKISKKAQNLISVARECFFKAAEKAVIGGYISDISKAVQKHTESNGLCIIRDWTGHGVGRALHEDPEIPNFYEGKRGSRLVSGMTLAIEPMIAISTGETKVLRDNWTVVTDDGSLAAHYEHTVLITNDKPQFLTKLEGSV